MVGLCWTCQHRDVGTGWSGDVRGTVESGRRRVAAGLRSAIRLRRREVTASDGCCVTPARGTGQVIEDNCSRSLVVFLRSYLGTRWCWPPVRRLLFLRSEDQRELEDGGGLRRTWSRVAVGENGGDGSNQCGTFSCQLSLSTVLKSR